MTTPAAEDVERPKCKCHGEPMVKNSRERNGSQKWACGRNRRRHGRRVYWERGGKQHKRTQYEDRVARGVCARCEGPLTSERLCWNCLSELEERRALYF